MLALLVQFFHRQIVLILPTKNQQILMRVCNRLVLLYRICRTDFLVVQISILMVRINRKKHLPRIIQLYLL
jgi:hypothetical protein